MDDINKDGEMEWKRYEECESYEQRIFDEFPEYMLLCSQSQDSGCYCDRKLKEIRYSVKKTGEGSVYINSTINGQRLNITLNGIDLRQESVDATKMVLKRYPDGTLSFGPIPKEGSMPTCTMPEKETYRFCVEGPERYTERSKVFGFSFTKDIPFVYKLAFRVI